MAIGTALDAGEQFRKSPSLDTRVVAGSDAAGHQRDGGAAVDSAIAHGVLSAVDDGLLRFAIPSLHTYMLAHELRRGERQQQAA